MAISNFTARKVQFKIVIYGPAFAGKTTALNYIREHIDAESVSELQTLKSAADKTLTFEFAPRGVTLLDDFEVQFEVSTVPGSVVFNAPRKLVLRDADGILFVADSEWPKIADNVVNFKNLDENLKKLGADVDDIPLVLAYNKRDLPRNRAGRLPRFRVKQPQAACALLRDTGGRRQEHHPRPARAVRDRGAAFPRGDAGSRERCCLGSITAKNAKAAKSGLKVVIFSFLRVLCALCGFQSAFIFSSAC